MRAEMTTSGGTSIQGEDPKISEIIENKNLSPLDKAFRLASLAYFCGHGRKTHLNLGYRSLTLARTFLAQAAAQNLQKADETSLSPLGRNLDRIQKDLEKIGTDSPLLAAA